MVGAPGDVVERRMMEHGHALVRLGRTDEGYGWSTRRELSRIVTGIVYCHTIAFCRSTYQLRGVMEWTEALTDGARVA
jgi:hypothetical protein